MNYWDKLRKENLKEVEYLERLNKRDKESIEVRKNEIKVYKDVEQKIEDVIKLFDDDIKNFVEGENGKTIHYSKDIGWHNNWKCSERQIQAIFFFHEKKIKKQVSFTGKEWHDPFDYTELDGVLHVLKNENERLQTFIDKYQPIINKIYDMAEKDNYVRTFNEYLKELENEL
jgi:hypothetical protein